MDDEDNILRTTKTLLQTYQYQVLTASNGIEAIAVYAEHKDEVRLVLMDLMMPEMDGLTAIKAIQTTNSQVKIVATSGLESDYRQSAQELGITTFLTKPFTTQDLIQQIQTQLAYR